MTQEPVVQIAVPSLRLRLLRWSVSPRLHATLTIAASAALWGSHATELYVWVFVVIGLLALVPLVWVLTATGVVVGRHCRVAPPFACALRWQAVLGLQLGLHFYWVTQIHWGC